MNPGLAHNNSAAAEALLLLKPVVSADLMPTAD